MTHWTPEQLAEYEERRKAQDLTENQVDLPDPEPESALSKKIRSYCKAHGWPCLVLPQNKKLAWFIPDGWPDGVLVVPKRVIFVELKAAKGRKSKDQILLAQIFERLGHKIHELKSYKRFLEILYDRKKS